VTTIAGQNSFANKTENEGGAFIYFKSEESAIGAKLASQMIEMLARKIRSPLKRSQRNHLFGPHSFRAIASLW
jgi:hypothetical protein